MSSIKKNKIITHTIVYIILIIGSIIFMIPFLWMLSTALKETGAVFTFPPQLIPKTFKWSNFSEAWTIAPFNIFLKNTTIVCIINVIGSVISSSIVAFGFSRLEFKGRDFIFMVLLGSMMIPSEVTLIPLYVEFKYFGWIDSLKALIIPSFFGSAYYIFLLRQYLLTIPLDLDEAATIDGCSTFQIYLRIIMPIIRPALVTVAVFQLMGSWNDFMGPLIFLNNQRNYTLTLGLNLFRNNFYTEWNYLMAISTIITVVPLAAFFLAQKHLIGGIAMSGMKA